MKSRKLVKGMGIIGAMIMGCGLLAGCGAEKEKAYDVYFFNGKSEIAESLEALTKDYEKETGKKVKILTSGTTESMETLRSEMSSKEMPTIFTANQTSITEWCEGGFALNGEEIPSDELKGIYESVADNMRLKQEGTGNYGIPYNVEGYGLIVNTQMICDIFGLENADTFLVDYKAADYKEFEQMVIAVDGFIKGEGVKTCTLNGTIYTTQETKTELASKLNGVFAIAGAEKWTYGNHYTNYAANAVFKDYSETMESAKEKVAELTNPLVKSLQQMDFLTSYTAGPNGALMRGADYINSTITGYDQTVQTFAQGKALFIKQGNWIYPNVAGVDETAAKNLTMLPMKVNFEASDVTAEGMTVEKMNQSIAEFVSQYYIVNAKASEEEIKEACDFLVWLNTSEVGQDYIINKFAFVPFNADGSTTLENPLSNSLISYMEEGNTLANSFDAYPSSWGLDSIGAFIMEQLLIQPEAWSEEQIRTGVEESVGVWQEKRSK